MTGLRRSALLVLTILAVTACGSDQPAQTVGVAVADADEPAPAVPAKAAEDQYDGTVSKPGSPYAISYRIVGTPIIGSPVVIDLRVTSMVAPRPVTLDYRINDATSMMFAESQPASVRMEVADNENAFRQRVTVIPQREGRFYLNVSASYVTDDGTVATVTSIPIQVGSAPREMQEHGELEEGENGEAVRVLTSE